MAGEGIQPHRITRFVQLPAVWLLALVLIVGGLISAAVSTTDPWLSRAFGITAVVIILPYLGLVFLLQTKFRPELLEDAQYLEFKKRQEAIFKDFSAENLQHAQSGSHPPQSDNTWEYLERKRVATYEGNRGLFLVHTWRPSLAAGQVADIAINLAQHREGPLSEGKVKYVEYHLGPMFFDYPVIKTDPTDDFRLDVSAYSPMLCLARVHFTDGQPPLELQRYIDFPIP